MATEIATRVKGIVIKESGGPEVMRYDEFDLPQPGPGEARVKIHAAGVNFIDIYQRTGRYQVPLPYTPGREAAGIVEAVGSGVTEVKPGDRVAWAVGIGGYAHATNIQANSLIPFPADLSFVQAAAFPLQGMTAHYLVHEFYQPGKGDTVLIHAAAGGMGRLLVQWAKHLGAKVLGTVSSEKKAQVAKDAGADEVIIYTKKDFVQETKIMTAGKGVDLIIDGVGKTTFPGDLEAVKVRGHVVIFGSASGPADPIGPNSLQARSISVHGGSLQNYVLTREEILSRANAVLAGISAGWLSLKVDHVLPLDQAAEAHQLLENRETTGKVVLEV